MKVLTILGTRPEIIRLSRIIEKLDNSCEHILVYTGQNYDPNLADIFFKQMGVRAPNHILKARGSLGEQLGILFSSVEKIIVDEKPDKILILGDTNSALSAIIAKRHGIPVYHMEAGNRCFDDRVPEEVNRRIIDHCSDILLPYTKRSRQNLLHEGIPGNRIFVTGNPIYEVIQYYDKEIEKSQVLSKLKINTKEYFLVTLHRAENVDIESRLRELTLALEVIQTLYKLPVIISTHPHTKVRMKTFKLFPMNSNIHFLKPFGFFDFIKLEKNALCVLSDSGTVQEECAIFKVANITLRDVTERPETLEGGSNILVSANKERIVRCVDLILNQKQEWTVPSEYMNKNVSDTVLRLLHGFLYQN